MIASASSNWRRCLRASTYSATGQFIAPLSHLYPSYFKLHVRWPSFCNSNYLGHHRVKDKLKPPFLLQMTIKAGLMMILTIMDQQS
ncbi:hypothetical protein YE105_C3056 [Yersinia enterocolitica subsp. palearctica 105.5R(r)]|nr:hypothetical protein YE105_C3056 [Yersinia enterocolitica subsp. palearctica 105.5R(r)]